MSLLIAASSAHAEALAAIHATAFPPAEQWNADSIAILVAQPGAFGFIHADGAMVLARVAADEGEILTLATAPALRRQGHARELLLAAQARAAGAGARSIFLEVSEANEPAKGLYDSLGYRQVGLRPFYYGATSAMILRFVFG